MNAGTKKVVRITSAISGVTVSYFLLTSDYGPQLKALDPIKKAILSGEDYIKGLIFGTQSKSTGTDERQQRPNHEK